MGFWQPIFYKPPLILFSYILKFNMIKLSFLIVVVIGVQAICPSNTQIPEFQTGVLSLQSFSANNIFTHTFGYQFKSAPTIAIGIMSLSYNGQNDPAFNHFSIKTSSVNPSEASFALNPSQQGNWQNIQINFWASSRQQIVLGSGHVNVGSLQGRSVTKFFTVNPIPNYISSIIRPFLNGFSVNSPSTQIDIFIQGTSLKQNQIPLMISAGQATNLKEVWFSYVIFSPSSLQYASYGGLAAEVGFKDEVHTNIHTIIHQTKNVLIGVTKLKSSLSKGFQFSSSVDSNLILSYQNKQNPIDFFLTYLVMGVAPSKLCSACSEEFALDSQCVSQCPSNTYPFTYRDKGKGCRKCSAKLNEVVNAQRTGCMKSQTPLNSFEPQQQISRVSPSIPKKSSTNLTSDSCKLKEHSYWTGYRCACQVGYKESRQTGTCQKMVITLPKPKVRQIPTCNQGQIYNGQECVCKENYHRNAYDVCVENIKTCPSNSQNINGECVCNGGYRKSGQLCISVCGANSMYVNNNCECLPGYKMVLGGCVKDNQECPSNSSRDKNGKCQCNPGFKQISTGFCSRCNEGQFWNGNSCIYTCGINQIFDYGSGKCKCKDGYGYLDGVCSLCSGHYFLNEGYCVACPLNSYYDSNLKKCACESGFESVNGICERRCQADQVFIPSANACKCFIGLGRIGGMCQVCPGGQVPDPNTEQCSQCSSNQRYHNGRCECLAGFGLDATGYCVKCEDKGLVLLNGVCGNCPHGRNWDGNKCACPAGAEEINGACLQKCGSNQLSDEVGNCYYCPLYEQPVNGACQCKEGFNRNHQNKRCEIKCKVNQVLINGLCASCSLNTVYDPILGSCVCPDGFYLNNYGICEKRDLIPVTCDDGFYYVESQGCVACPYGCKTCQNANRCLSCTAQGFVPSGKQCKPDCGDGKIIRGIQQCDDNNKISGDGCSSTCTVEDDYVCDGEPSVCESTAPPPPASNCGNGQKDAGEGCDDGNTKNGDGCSSSCSAQEGYSCDESSPSVCTKAARNIKLVGNVINNSAAVYLTVETTPSFKFNNEQEMRQFMKYSFTNNADPSSAYCNQRFGNGALFDCIFLYPSGVPLMGFVVELRFEREGKSGYIAIPVDTSNSVFSLRSLN